MTVNTGSEKWHRNGKSLHEDLHFSVFNNILSGRSVTHIHILKLYFTLTRSGIGSTQVGRRYVRQVRGRKGNQTEGKMSGVKGGIRNFWLRFLVRGARKTLYVERGGGGWSDVCGCLGNNKCISEWERGC